MAAACRRRGVTLIEVLVALGVMSLLLGLILPAILRAREMSDRVACQSNLRQIALALTLYHLDHGALPPGRTPVSPPVEWHGLSWMVHILPYLDMRQEHDEARAACLITPATFSSPPHVVAEKVVPLYVCPLDSRLRSPQLNLDGELVGLSSYLGVAGGTKFDGLLGLPGRGISFDEAFDGLSFTLLVGERPPPDTFGSGQWYGAVARLGGDPLAGPFRGWLMQALGGPPDPCGGPVGFGPGRTDNPCDRWHFWSLHPGGANFAFADGSVRFMPYGAKAIMPALATRDGGEIIPDFE